jgi:drug/metabolite transporter (DMT)-like permease
MVLIAGCTPAAARFAMREMPTFATGALRFSIVSVLLLATARFLVPRDAKAKRPIDRRDCPRILLCALLCVPVNQAAFLGGVKLASAAHAGLLYALNPVLVYVLTVAMRQVGLSSRMAAAALLAFGGAAIIGFDGLRAASDVSFFAGDVLLFIAVAAWATYSVLVTPLGEKYGAVRALTLITVSGTAMYLPALMIDASELNFAGMSPPALAGFAYMTILTSYFNYILWFIVLMRTNVNRLAVGMSVAPLVSVFAAHYLCGDPITRWLALGAAFVLTGITLSNWDKLRVFGRRPFPATLEGVA